MIYDFAALAAAIISTPDGFRTGYWAQLPAVTRTFLKRTGQKRLFCDTGRLVNLILLDQGYLLHCLVQRVW